MTIEEYQVAAARTLIDSPDFKLTDKQLMTIWCLTGLIGEVGELAEAFIFEQAILYPDGILHGDFYKNNRLKIKEEIGDVLWYLAGICTKQNLSLQNIIKDISINWEGVGNKYHIKNILLNVCRIAENIKKGIFHQHEIDREKLAKNIKIIFLALQDFANEFDFNIFEIMDANINKLKIRYPNGYNSQDSKARKDKN